MGRPRRSPHDLVVVGAGLVGSYTAGVLTRAGRDVALVEARYPGAGASGRNGGFALVGMQYRYSEAVERFGRGRAREIWALAAENVHRLGDLAQEHGVEHERCGTTYLDVRKMGAEQLRESAKLLQEDGHEAEFVDGDPTRRGYLAALFRPSDIAFQPAKLAAHLAKSSGATLYGNDEVFSVERDGSGAIVRTRQRTIRCEKVMLALNAYAGLLFPFFRRLVEPSRGQVLVTQPLPRLIDTMCLQRFGGYFRQLPDGRLLIGAGRYPGAANRSSFSEEVVSPARYGTLRYLARHFPEIEVRPSRMWAGTDGDTRDRLPVIGRLPDQPEVYFALGFSGRGNSLGLVAGELAAELMLNGTSAGVFDVARFD